MAMDEERAPLLFIAGGDDNLMPPAVNESNAKHYRHTKSVTDYKEFPGRSHYSIGQEGWEEVADYALEWVTANATRPAASSTSLARHSRTAEAMTAPQPPLGAELSPEGSVPSEPHCAPGGRAG
jgi:hypothetical protein